MENLPEEKILEICQQMDDVTLAKFIQTSTTNKRICNQMLKDRETRYVKMINDIINLITTRYVEVNLETTNKNRTFIIFLDRSLIVGYIIEEYITMSNVSALRDLKLTKREIQVQEKYPKVDTFKNALLELFRHGYITGNYKIVE